MDRRDFLTRFGGLSLAGLFLPEEVGWVAPDGQILQRTYGKDAYEGYFHMYGKLEFSGMDIYTARKTKTPERILRLLDDEVAGMKADIGRFVMKSLREAWPEPR